MCIKHQDIHNYCVVTRFIIIFYYCVDNLLLYGHFLYDKDFDSGSRSCLKLLCLCCSKNKHCQQSVPLGVVNRKWLHRGKVSNSSLKQRRKWREKPLWDECMNINRMNGEWKRNKVKEAFKREKTGILAISEAHMIPWEGVVHKIFKVHNDKAGFENV